MSGFIVRNYLGPQVSAQLNAVAVKKLYKECAGTSVIDGIPVLNRDMFFYGSAFTATKNNIRYDKTFNRFLRKIGVKHKDLSANNYSDAKNAYFKLAVERLTFTAKSLSQLALTFNDYAEYTIKKSNVLQNVYFSVGSLPGQPIHSLQMPLGTIGYCFDIGGVESYISSDGYFYITSYGDIGITDVGVTAKKNKVDYVNISNNSTTLNIKKFNTDGITLITPYIFNIYREFIDIRITVGGQYRNAVVINGVASNLETSNLAVIRSDVEANILEYVYGGTEEVSAVRKEYTTKASKLAPTVGIEYDTINGHIFDVTPLIGDISLFECINECMHEEISIEEIASSDILTNGGRSFIGGEQVSNDINYKYSYVKRYKIKVLATIDSPLIIKIKEQSDALSVNLSDAKSGNVPFYRRVQGIIKSSKNNMFGDMIYAINEDGVDPVNFYHGRLRLDAYEAMSPKEFMILMKDCFDTGYSAKDSGFLDKLLAVVVIVIAIVVAVLVTIISFGAGASVGYAILYGAMALVITLQVGGMIYAKHVGDAWGMKLIGNATQVASVILSVAAIYVGYVGVENAIATYGTASTSYAASIAYGSIATAAEQALLSAAVNAAAISIATSSASLAMSTLSLTAQLGVVDISDTEVMQVVTIAMALYGGYKSGSDLFSNLGGTNSASVTLKSLADTTFKNASNFLKLLENGAKAYAMIDNFNTDKPQSVVEEQATKESGVEAVYIMQERAYKNDALETMDIMIKNSFGLEKTQMLTSRIYGA